MNMGIMKEHTLLLVPVSHNRWVSIGTTSQLILHARGLQAQLFQKRGKYGNKARLPHKLVQLELGTRESFSKRSHQTIGHEEWTEKTTQKKKNDSSLDQQHAASSILLEKGSSF